MKRCGLHDVVHLEEPHPHKPGRMHSYCPECRKEAIANVAEAAHLADADVREMAAATRLAAAQHPMKLRTGPGIPGGSWVMRDGVLVPREHTLEAAGGE